MHANIYYLRQRNGEHNEPVTLDLTEFTPKELNTFLKQSRKADIARVVIELLSLVKNLEPGNI